MIKPCPISLRGRGDTPAELMSCSIIVLNPPFHYLVILMFILFRKSGKMITSFSFFDKFNRMNWFLAAFKDEQCFSFKVHSKIHPFSVCGLRSFDRCIVSYNYYHNQDREQFHPAPKFSSAVSYLIFTPSSHPNAWSPLNSSLPLYLCLF